MKLLVLYATTEGHTRKIAHFMEDAAEEMGWEVDMQDVTKDAKAPTGYDAVLLGASLHGGKYQAAIADYAKRYANELNGTVSGFVSVSLTAASKDEESWKELHEITDHFLNYCKWKPQMTRQTAGALKYLEYDWLKKMLMRHIAKNSGGSTDTKHDHEYTNWEELKQFVKDFLALKK